MSTHRSKSIKNPLSAEGDEAEQSPSLINPQPEVLVMDMGKPVDDKECPSSAKACCLLKKNTKQNLAELPETTRTTVSCRSKKERANTLENGFRHCLTRRR